MTIYVFVIDNSASMAQSSYAGATSLDLAKNFIEMFQKARQKESSKDRFMAVSCDDYPACIKTGWRENIGTMMDQLKKLQPIGTNSLETAIGRAFWFLNCNRQYTDFPGFGWCVAKPEPAIVIALTDGVFSLGPHFAPEKIKHPTCDFYKEVYRPDQRCYGVCFRVSARPTSYSTQFETATGGLANFCTTTGGKCFVVSNSRHVGIAVDAILQKSLVFLKLNFSYAGPDTDSDGKNGSQNDDSNSKSEGSSWKETFTGILRLPRKDFDSRFLWPIPENFWADYSLGQLPPRPECPNVSFTYDPKPAPSWKDGNLFDRYELEPSALTQYILEKKTGHYPIHVVGSGKNNRNYCCGYLVAEQTKGYFTNTLDYKVADNLARLTVILYLVPYNYPVLLSLLEEQEKTSNKKHLTPLLRQKFVDYITHVPVYYFSAMENKPALLKLLLRSLGTPEEDFNRITYHSRILSTISTWRASLRREYELSITTVHDLLKKVPDAVVEIPKSKVMVDTIFARYGPGCQEYTGDGPATFTIEHEPLPKPNPSALFYSAKYIPRKELIINLTKMRVNFNLYGRDHDLHVLQGGMPGQKIKLHEAEDLHNRSIKVMGDFESYNRKLRDIGFAPLREVVPPESTSHAFGNPFKLDKKVVAVDEVAEEGSPDTSQRSSSPSPRDAGKNLQQKKRKVRILDASDFTRLRERRGTYSETSSLPSLSRCASPFSDMEDLSSNIEMNGYDNEHKADIPAPNGTSLNLNLRGASPSPSLLNGFSSISLKRTLSMEDSDDGSSSECASPAPPPKRRRESMMSANGGVGYSKLKELKIQATKIVKQFTNLSASETVIQLRNLCEKLTTSDQIAILTCAEDVLQRLKRNAILSAVTNFRKKLQTGK